MSENLLPGGEAPQAADGASGARSDRAASSDSPESAPESPYKNLWVPLVVVPAAIVVAIVLVFVFFGAITGSAKSPEENLDLMLNGGANERTQAAMNLVLQLQENWEALAAGDEPTWPMDADFRRQLSGAWEATREGDHAERFVLASLQAQLGEEEGVERLLSLLELPSTPVEGGPTDFRDTIENLVDGKQVDPGGLRLQVLYELGILGPALAPEVREEVADAVLPLLHDADPGLAHMAALALQNLPGERSLEGLRSLLSSPRLDLRGQAAVSLSHLGDSTGAPVLRELVDPSSYDRDRADARARWTHGSSVSHSRARAVAALARLDLPDDRALLEELAADEPDPAVRQAAMRALEDRPDEP